jgi:hypothetical protein
MDKCAVEQDKHDAVTSQTSKQPCFVAATPVDFLGPAPGSHHIC